VLEQITEELRRVHGVHTLVLYGSHGRGDATPESDLDVAGFADVPATLRDARVWQGRYLDAFVYPTAVLTAAPDPELLKLLGGRVLVDDRGLATALLDAIAALDRRGPTPLTVDEAQMRRVWARKMLARIGRDDLEARYRHHGLLYQLLEDYFALRGRWYRGPKVAFAELAIDDPETLSAFERALAPSAQLAELTALVDRVTS
jgi:predicted nucleotidyltransferase